MALQLTDPVTSLKGVGPSLSEKLARVQIRSVRDLLFHLPLRYQDRTTLTRIGALRLNAEVVIEGEVELAQVVFARRRALLVRLSDGTGSVILRFFHFNRAQQQRFATGRRFRCFGEVRRGPQTFEMIHPECHVIDVDAPTPLEDRLTPIYPTTEGLQQGRLRKLFEQVTPLLEKNAGIVDYLPAETREALNLPSLERALYYIHRPPADAPVEQLVAGRHLAQRRLAFEELLAHQLSLKQTRQVARAFSAPRLETASALRKRFVANLSFELTGAQQRVINEIDQDLVDGAPMLRLLQGDVGSGKTAVAAMVGLNAIAAGMQATIMAPTELLAEQHLANFARWYGALDIPVELLSGRLTASQRRSVLSRIADGDPCMVVGTHALFQDGVDYPNLGMVIVDEQHRFGVHQRLALWDKGAVGSQRPHQLIMTATPIPRTLTMSAYADLDISVIDELPPARKPTRTTVLPDSRRSEIVERVAALCAGRRQAYWVCPLIDESDFLEAQAATEMFDSLRAALPSLRLGLVHGRMPDKEKSAVMESFANHQLDLLVATTVIEVGVDVPNASLMVIENAERLGLSQLHQLRGRVGRGSEVADCVLLYKLPLGETAKKRLHVMRETNDGFVIAERDLELRGPGEVLGTRQTGTSEYRIADLERDHDLLPRVQETAEKLIESEPDIAEKIIGRWLTHRVEYGNV